MFQVYSTCRCMKNYENVMKFPTREELTKRLTEARISKRIIRDLRYVPEEITHPDERDFLIVMNKAGSEGVLLYGESIISFQLHKRRANRTGRVEAIICDICATWRRGIGSATLTLKRSTERTTSYLVCADLDCSLHVRDLTNASKLSRTQLRENMTAEGRIERLYSRLSAVVIP